MSARFSRMRVRENSERKAYNKETNRTDRYRERRKQARTQRETQNNREDKERPAVTGRKIETDKKGSLCKNFLCAFGARIEVYHK